jgi:hypothetical protein
MALLPFWIFMGLLLMGMPVVFALLLGPGMSLWLDGRPDAFFGMMQQRLFNGLRSFPLMAVPFFILAGEIMNRGHITVQLVEFSKALIGHVRGGLAQVNILTSILFAGFPARPWPTPPHSARCSSRQWRRTATRGASLPRSPPPHRSSARSSRPRGS